MNAFFWKRIVILRKGKYKLFVIMLAPLLFSILFMNVGIEADCSLLLSSVCTSLLLPSFTWDVEDLINQENIQIYVPNIKDYVFGFFIFPGLTIYLIASVESFIFQIILWGMIELSFKLILMLILGLVFSIVCLVSANAEYLYYRIWVQYISIPFSLSMFFLPILSIYKKEFMVNNIVLIMLIGILAGCLFLFMLMIKFDSEKSLISKMKLVKGYGELND